MIFNDRSGICIGQDDDAGRFVRYCSNKTYKYGCLKEPRKMTIYQQTISMCTTLYCIITYIDIHRIKTFCDDFQNNSWININLVTRAVIGENLSFLPRSGKFSVMTNCLNFFITDYTVNLEIAHLFEIELELCPDIWKLIILCLKSTLNSVILPIVNVRITMVILYAPRDVLCWNYRKYSTDMNNL